MVLRTASVPNNHNISQVLPTLNTQRNEIEWRILIRKWETKSLELIEVWPTKVSYPIRIFFLLRYEAMGLQCKFNEMWVRNRKPTGVYLFRQQRNQSGNSANNNNITIFTRENTASVIVIDKSLIKIEFIFNFMDYH